MGRFAGFKISAIFSLLIGAVLFLPGCLSIMGRKTPPSNCNWSNAPIHQLSDIDIGPVGNWGVEDSQLVAHDGKIYVAAQVLGSDFGAPDPASGYSVVYESDDFGLSWFHADDFDYAGAGATNYTLVEDRAGDIMVLGLESNGAWRAFIRRMDATTRVWSGGATLPDGAGVGQSYAISPLVEDNAGTLYVFGKDRSSQSAGWTSIDRGVNWTLLVAPTLNIAGQWLTGATYDPVNDAIYVASRSDSYAGPPDSSILKSTDHGATWTSVYTLVHQAPNGFTFLGTVTWFPDFFFASGATVPDTVGLPGQYTAWAGRSTDGASWTQTLSTNSIAPSALNAAVKVIADPNSANLYMLLEADPGTSGVWNNDWVMQLWVSKDRGSSWQQTSQSFPIYPSFAQADAVDQWGNLVISGTVTVAGENFIRTYRMGCNQPW